MDIFFLPLISFGIALALSLVTIPTILNLSHKFHWYDDLDERKIHSGNMPHIGGIGIAASSLVGLALFLLINTIFPAVKIISFSSFLPFLLSYLVIHFTGVFDDFLNMKARYKFLFQIGAACLVAFTGNAINSIELPWFSTTVHLGFLARLITIVWLVGVCNAMNFIDGMDGLAGGVSAIAALFYGVFFTVTGSFFTAAFAFALFGALIGFLFFNWPPAKIFMGDCGALFLGFALASLPLIEHSGQVTLPVLLAPFGLLLIPVLDTVFSIFRRIKRKIAVYSPDKEHTHHKLLDMGFEQPLILGIFYGLATLPGIFIVLWIVFEKSYFFWFEIFSWLIIVGFFILLDWAYHKPS